MKNNSGLYETVTAIHNDLFASLDPKAQFDLIIKLRRDYDPAQVRDTFYSLAFNDPATAADFAYLLGKAGWDAPLGDPLTGLCGFPLGVSTRTVSESIINWYLENGREQELGSEFQRLGRQIKIEQVFSQPVAEWALPN